MSDFKTIQYHTSIFSPVDCKYSLIGHFLGKYGKLFGGTVML